jgi:hypothetical protein
MVSRFLIAVNQAAWLLDSPGKWKKPGDRRKMQKIAKPLGTTRPSHGRALHAANQVLTPVFFSYISNLGK